MPEPAFQELLKALSQPGADQGAADPEEPLECIQTHISAVFLSADRAFKLKKPKDLGFLDFTTVERRRHYCHEEVRLNRRLAARVYEGVVPVVRGPAGRPMFSERIVEVGEEAREGEVLDWAVRMVRLPEHQTVKTMLRDGRLTEDILQQVAKRIADFHAEAEGGEEVARLGDWPTVRENDRENFEQVAPFVGSTISRQVFDRLEALTRVELDRRRGLIESRAREGVPRDTHGDLRLEHLYLLPRAGPIPSSTSAPNNDSGEVETEVVAVDCVEFNERFRWADPVADLAFPVMELELEGREDLARTLADRYFEASEDLSGRALLPYYATYRDMVRGKVRSLEADDSGVPSSARDLAARKATRHFLKGLSRLSNPGDRPVLLVLHGLPGVGKSTVAHGLAASEGFEWIDTDRVRKDLAMGEEVRGEAGFEEGIYSRDWTDRTYRECRRRAAELLWKGQRVLIEGSFGRDVRRRSFREVAIEMGVPVLFFHLTLGTEEVRRRLERRTEGPSDADFRIHRKLAERWEASSPEVEECTRRIPLEGMESGEAVDRVRLLLREVGLAGRESSDEPPPSVR